MLKFYIVVKYSLIRNMIEQKKITLKEFCEKIGMTRQGFEPAILKGTVSANVLMKMSEVLGVPVSSFFDEFESIPDAKDSEIIELQRKYIASLEKRLDAYEGSTVKRAG